MIRQPSIKFKSKPIIILMILTLITALMGLMGVFKGGLAQDAEDVLGRGPEPTKLHVYPYTKLVFQVLLYTLVFLIPGFTVTSALYPRLFLPERIILSTAFGALLYSLYMTIFLATGNTIFFVMSQIFWDLFYMVIVTTIGLVVWRKRLSKLRT